MFRLQSQCVTLNLSPENCRTDASVQSQCDKERYMTERRQTKRCPVCDDGQEYYFHYAEYDYYRCSSCGLVSTLPVPTEAEIEAHYRRKFEQGNYSLLLRYRDEYRTVYKTFVNVLEHGLKKKGTTLQGKRILDIGCFTGDLLLLLSEKGADVYGLELQSEAVALANDLLPGRIYQADVYGTSFPRMQFDIITFTGLIEHLVEPVKLVRRVYELLAPGGLALLQTPDSGSLPAKLLQKYWPPYMPVEHIHLFTRKSIAVLLEQNNFTGLAFKRHIKKLPLSYVYQMFQNFGPEFYRLLTPLYRVCPSRLKAMSLPFYGGEMIATAWKAEAPLAKRDY